MNVNDLRSVVPACLRDRAQWVAWRLIIRDGKETKAPVSPHDGSLADSTSKATWGTFDQAVEARQKYRSLAGIGFVFSADDLYCGVDLDDCIDADGNVKPWALELLAKLDSYTEISPSGLGLKVFIKASKPGSRCRKAYADGEVEIYDRDRFFAVTGDRLPNVSNEVNLRQEELEFVYARVFGDEEPDARISPDAPVSASDSTAYLQLSDDEIIHLASSQRGSGEKFKALWAGNWQSQLMNSPSEADASVIFTLAYFTKDEAQIDRIFRRSALMRPKWNELRGNESYGQRTIARALRKVVKQYSPKAKRSTASRLQLPPNLGFPKSAIDREFKSEQTENAMAVEFINANQTQLRYVPPWKKWLAWDGKRWKIDIDSSRTTRLARRLVRNYWDRLLNIQSEKQQKQWADFCRWANRKTTIENVVNLARCDARTAIDHELLNQNTDFLNLQNGTIDLTTREFREHRQTDSITQIANVAFDPHAQCPKWKAFIDLIFGEDDQAKRYIQALLGYSCSGDVGEHILPICYGAGANGKSTLWNAIVELLGDYAMLAPSKLLLGTANEHDTIIASLYQRRLVAISEPDEGAKLREARVKELTGDEQITARRMREDYWSFHRTHKFWLSTNHLPRITGTDEGIWRRIKLIPFRVDLRQVTKPIPDYHKVLVREEGPGILNWLLDGFQDWREHGFIEPSSIIDETKSYRGKSDEIGRFIEDCCVVAADLVVPSSELYAAYREWGGMQTQTRFSILMQKNFVAVKASAEPYYQSRLRSEPLSRGGFGWLRFSLRGSVVCQLE
ncbi:MAG: phage/plasmid primase, P4 family [Pirellulaceae bacterium]|nr:phage/plasmid primase, P4 family [Pirellulaceae bacterium]